MSLLDSVIRSASLNQFVYSRVKFDNAKDTSALIEAANESNELLIMAIQAKLEGHIEQMLSEYLEKALGEHREVSVRINGKMYILKEK